MLQLSEGSKEKRGKLAGESKANGAKQAPPKAKQKGANAGKDLRTEIDSW